MPRASLASLTIMFEKLEIFCKRLEEINQKLCDPSVLADTAQYTGLLKESSSITPIVEKYRQYLAAMQQEADALEMLSENEEYTFDEDKNTKQEINEIFNLLKHQQEYFWNAQKNLVKNELKSDKPSYRISSALRIISEYKLIQAQQEINELLDGNDEIILCEAVITLKQLNLLESVDKETVLNKVHDENKKALIQSLIC